MFGIFEFGIFGIFFLLMEFVPFFVFIFIIINIVKKSKNRAQGSNYHNRPVNRNVRRDDILAPGENFKVEKLNSPMQDNYSSSMQNSYNSTEQDNHDHAYVHKVEPIDEISIMTDEDSTIAMLNEKREEQAEENRIDDMRSDYLDRNAAKNADIHTNMSYGEKKVICKYCGAENIVARGEKKTCYFCRQEL